MNISTDEILIEKFLKPVRECYKYKPAFGLAKQENGVSYQKFEEIFGDDPFYSLIGLATPSVYAAHKAAGGLTSVYRQLGIGSERLFRAILSQQLSLNEDSLLWSYKYATSPTKSGIHTLDACLRLTDLTGSYRSDIEAWIKGAVSFVGKQQINSLEGVIFEVRQGYKSADSKRQNADLRFGLNAYQSNMLPVFAIFSNQVSYPVITRYRMDGMLVLTGLQNGNPYTSTFEFLKEITGFDLIAFLERNQEILKKEVQGVVNSLLMVQ